MEEDRQEVFNHVCKFCSRSFPCGRSLGGHVKSHLIIIRNNYSSSAKNTISKIDVDGTTGHSRKEKPNKSKRVAEDNFQDQDHDHDQSSQEDTSGLESIIDSHSDNATATPTRNQRRIGRSKRRIRLDSNCNNLNSNYDYDRDHDHDPNGSSSVFEIEHEQEEVAICLIMLSRDIRGFSKMTDDISVRNSVSYTKGTECEILKKKYKLQQKKNSKFSDIFANSTKRQRQQHQEAEFSISKMDKTEVFIDEFVKVRPGTSELSKIEVSEMDIIVSKDLDKKPKFQCVTCKRSFSSYQALGGHRASHKKNKDGLCCGSKVKPNITINSNNNDNKNGYSENKKTRHECPICLKVFTSGQALGGHKRAHLVDASEVQEDGTTATDVVVTGKKPGCEIRSVLDLNKPALVEEDVKFHMGLNNGGLVRSTIPKVL